MPNYLGNILGEYYSVFFQLEFYSNDASYEDDNDKNAHASFGLSSNLVL